MITPLMLSSEEVTVMLNEGCSWQVMQDCPGPIKADLMVILAVVKSFKIVGGVGIEVAIEGEKNALESRIGIC